MQHKKVERLLLPLLSFTFLILIIVFFHDFLMTYIVQPIAVFFWDVLRILMSIDQVFFYAAVIFLFFILLLRLLPHRSLKPNRMEPGDIRSHAHGIPYWRSVFLTALKEPDQEEFLREKMRSLTLSAITIKEKISETEAKNCLLENSFAMPESVHQYISRSPSRKAFDFSKVAAWFYRRAPHLMQPWYNHQIQDQQKKMDHILNWLEDYLEMKHDEQA